MRIDRLSPVIDNLSLPSCLICDGSIKHYNKAFFELDIHIVPPYKERIKIGDKFYMPLSSVMPDGSELVIFNDITREVHLERENQKHHIEMGIAKRIQNSLIHNSLPEEEGYEFSAAYIPSAEVGGDLFDALRLPDGRILMYVADVSGHGVSAAMLTVFFKQVISIFCKDEVFKFKKLVERLNDRLAGINCSENVYMTLFIALLNTQTGQLKYFNAGHSAIPLLRRNDGTIEELYSPGIPICTWGFDRSYDIKITNFERGDRLVLYTDGVFPGKAYEAAFSEFKELFANAGISDKEFINIIKKKAKEDNDDDVLMILCSRNW